MPLEGDDREHTLQQLSDMFRGVSMQRLRIVCEANNWNLNTCIDQLVETETDEMSESTASSSSRPLTTSGAIPKVSPPLCKFQQSCNNINNCYAKSNNRALNDETSKELKIGEQIKSGYRIMVIMRGAPGSGKTYLAHLMMQKYMPQVPEEDIRHFILSSDDYFYDAAGRYKYSTDRLAEAHDYNQKRVFEKAETGWSPIIVDNTNMKLWEMLPYVQAAVKHGYLVELLEPKTTWHKSARKLAMLNRHGVPRETIERMLDKYEKGNTSDLLKMLKDTKYTVPLPQLRSYPPVIVAPQCEIETEEKFQIFNRIHGENSINKALPTTNTSAWNSTTSRENSNDSTTLMLEDSEWKPYENSTEPKEQRSRGSRAHITSTSPFPQQTEKQTTFTNAWKPYENDSKGFWSPNESPTKGKEEHANVKTGSDKTLLDIIKENFNAPIEVNDVNSFEQGKAATSLSIDRHSIGCPNENSAFVALRQIYPKKNISNLWDLFLKCSGDADWVANLLLKEDEMIRAHADDENIDYVNDDDFICLCKDSNQSLLRDNSKETSTPLQDENVMSNGNSSKRQRQRSRWSRSKQRNSSSFRELEEFIQKSFVLGSEHYTEEQLLQIYDNEMDREYRDSPTKVDSNFHDAETQTDIQSIIENSDDGDDSDEKERSDNEEMLEITLGEKLIQQLIEYFRHESSSLLNQTRTKLPLNMNVFMSRSLAKRLYMLCMESVHHHIEEERQKIIREDEDFARLLKSPKYAECKESPANVRELLDMEMALMIYNQDREDTLHQEKEIDKPKDLATHLTQMKLCETFPDIPRDTLLDILAANGNNYNKTVSILQSTMNTGNECDRQSLHTMDQKQERLMQCARREKELLNREAQINLQKPEQIDTKDPFDIKDDNIKEMVLRKFEETRNLADHHRQLKNECYKKAQEAIVRGQGAVAPYYSQIAELHKKKIDMYNQVAANCIMEVHKYNQNNQDLLDLHYLYVAEALECLDIFLDRHITELRSSSDSSKNVFIITGRGLHSAGGVSTIKSKVKARLQERNLKWHNENAGLLKVKIFPASRHSKNF
uniref:Smr domain-containing protein n=1 Tax=Glossina brevipalpis TaxID=37001 RepID=A0A1A9WE34_9MUSC